MWQGASQDPIIPHPMSRIGKLQQRYAAQQQDLPLLEEQISLLQDTITHAEEPDLSSVSLAECHYVLGVALYHRYMHVQALTDLEAAVTHLRIPLRGHAHSACFPGPSSVLGSALRALAFHKQSAEMCEECISLHRRPHVTSEDIHVPLFTKAHHARELGMSLGTHYSMNKPDDHAFSESVKRLENAHAWDPSDHISAAALGEVLMWRWAFTGQNTLDDAVFYGQLALDLCGPTHRDFFWVQKTLAHAQIMRVRFFDSAAMQTLGQVIDDLRAAIAEAPPVWKRALGFYLSDAYNIRYKKQGNGGDLADPIPLISALLEGLRPEDLYWSDLQAAYYQALHTRFRVTGVPDDLEGATSAAEQALSATTVGTRKHVNRALLLATCRTEQHKSFGDITHLNDAIAMLDEVFHSTTSEDVSWKMAARNLIVCLPQRYQYTGTLADLDRAADLASTLIADIDEKDVYTRTQLHIAGNIFLLRFQATGVLSDLDRATALLQEAARSFMHDLSEKSDARNYEALITYFNALRIRYEVLHEDESAVKAFELHTEISTHLSDAHPARTPFLCGLARLQLCTEKREEAFDSLIDALDNNYCPAYRRFKEVWDVLRSAGLSDLDHKGTAQLSVVYSTAIALLPQVASFGLEPRARLSVVAAAGSLAAQAATHAISCRQPSLALEMLEAGRNVFWTQALQLRTSFAELPEAVGDRLTRITYALAQPIPDGLEGQGRDRELVRRRQLGDDFRTALANARRVPGFEGLLQNAGFASLAHAAAGNPVVVLVAGRTSGCAIIITSNAECRLVDLLRADAQTMQALSLQNAVHSKRVRSSRGMRKVEASGDHPANIYGELWTSVMLPIIESLQWPKAEGRQRPRLILCPTGVFMQLPLHASGIYAGDDPVCCSDYFVASYTPSISALLHVQQTYKPVRRSAAMTLLVAVGQSYQEANLPMTHEEAGIVRRLVSPSSNVIQVSTCTGMLEHIQSASILHMACHGTQDLAHALHSSFHLEDGPLAVSKLMELELPAAFLAVLSACETAKGDAAQPDQTIHLAATMLFAGFKSVVATMWFMGDSEGPEIAEGIYSALFKENPASECLDPEIVPYALDDVVQKLRRSGLDPSFWATYVHIGI